jgi:hypothetical protein
MQTLWRHSASAWKEKRQETEPWPLVIGHIDMPLDENCKRITWMTPWNSLISCVALKTSIVWLRVRISVSYTTLPSVWEANTVKCHTKWQEYPCFRKCSDSLYDTTHAMLKIYLLVITSMTLPISMLCFGIKINPHYITVVKICK